MLHPLEHALAVFGKPVEIVDEIDEQKFLAQGTRECGLDAEVERPAAERKSAVPLMIADDCLVVELRRADPELVVCVGRGDEKPSVFEKTFDELVVVSGRFAERCLLRIAATP